MIARPNRSVSAQPLTFTLTTASGVRKATASRKVVQAPKPPPPPLQITSQEELPVGYAGTPYSATLTASGGTGSYHWTVTGGALPAGLTLSISGTISGTPTGADGGTINVQVRDDANVADENTVTIAITGGAPPISSPSFGESINWSGYALEGGPFTAVSAAFNIPQVPVTSTDTNTSEWIGIDGAQNANLIQAGIDELVQNGVEHVFAWWEILPAPATIIPDLAVNPNDQVTIVIVRQADGNWLIQFQDPTSGASWHTTVAYSGPLASAEWIVEAPALASSGAIQTLGQYSPPVTFRNLTVSGAGSRLDQIVMYDTAGGSSISTPSPLTPAGFTVAYGSGTPPPPG
jgi:Peptidase A4 family/Putative Ig domain